MNDDLISRQQAIDEVMTLPNCENGYSETYDKGRFISLLEELPPAEKRGEWIPVSERLPKELINPVTSDFCEYLCTIKIDDDYYARTYKFGDMHWWHALRMMDEYVIAWMELPEPYRGEE